MNKNGKFEGHGILVCPVGKYEGSFEDGLKHGMGEFNFSKGMRYTGEYVEGVRHGSGTIYRKNGAVAFCGEIRNGVPNGKGYVIDPKGK